MKLALTLPGYPSPIDSGLPGGAPSGGLYHLDSAGKLVPGGTGTSVISAAVTLIIIAAILFAIWAVGKTGWDIITSRGHKDKIKTDADRIFYAMFGLIMVFLSFVFLSIAKAFFGVDLLPFLIWK